MSNVMLIDPNNDVNINPNIVNGIPQYQNMHIFAELIATRKGRTVLVSQGELNNYSIEETGLENTKTVNFIGNNQNINSPNYLNFTTNYYDGSSGNDVQYEGFGMTSIKVVINASFVPQVNIQFVDIRGLAFFNRENSPYRILFDFPPPIFNLTIKGYYGKALSYELHLVKYISEFKAENGNYVIDAQFVAMTFAPLSDVLLRYIINFPLIDNNNLILSPDTGIKPTCTYGLILKLKNLYSAVSKQMKADIEVMNFENIKTQISNIDNIILMLNNYQENVILNKNNTPYLIVLDNAPSSFIESSNIRADAEPEIIPLKNLNEYNKYIKDLKTNTRPENINKRLYIVYYKGPIPQSKNSISLLNPDPSYAILNPPVIVSGDLTSKRYNSDLEIYRLLLMKQDGNAPLGITENDISIPKNFNNNYNIKTAKNEDDLSNYIGIDLTSFYWTLYQAKTTLNEKKVTTSISINTKINNLIVNKLGMMPTIYNIFEIILNDVDLFFNKMRKTASDAENKHHNLPELKNLILDGGQYADIGVNSKNNEKTHIFAFPLVINKQPVSGGYREIRIAPIELSESLKPNPFPEITLVNEFIKTFFLQTQYNELLNMKGELNADGTLKWIPISPIDSILTNNNSIESPYINTLTPFGIINESPKNILVQVFDTMLKRFYILSQYSNRTTFYGTNTAFLNLFANSEAINLASSISNLKQGGLLKEAAQNYVGKIENFYTELKKPEYNDYYDFTEDSKKFFPMFGDVAGITDAYVDKTNTNYSGIEIYRDDISIEEPNKNSNKLIDKFMAEYAGTGIKGWLTRDDVLYSSFKLTKENVFYINDEHKPDESLFDKKDFIINRDSNNLCLDTRYLCDAKDITLPKPNKINLFPNGPNNDKIITIDLLLKKGNNAFNTIVSNPRNIKHRGFYNIATVWVDQLSKYDVDIKNSIINNESKLGALLYLSNFGYTLSPFSEYPTNLSNSIFNIPAAISVPTYLSPYIGALIEAIENSDPDFTTTTIYDFFTTGDGKVLSSSGLFIFADIYDIQNYLSDNDKNIFKTEFNNFYIENVYYKSIFTSVKELYNIVNDQTRSIDDKKTLYQSYLDPNSTTNNNHMYYNYIIQPLIKRTNIINYSEITFKNDTTIPTYKGYQSLKYIDDYKTTTTKELKKTNDIYFNTFFSRLLSEIISMENEIKKIEKENENLKNDIDIVTQTYYSLKNVNDKWLTSPKIADIAEGYPFNDKGKKLIQSFAFVDRAMNPVGDTIMNAEILSEMFDDPNISVFTALSQLLSLNGFEFFPLQNFMSYDDKENSWKDSFKIDMSGEAKKSPAYICMFIGGTSSYPSGGGNGFVDDSIENIENTNSPEFNTKIDPSKDIVSIDEQSNPKFPYRQVRAFRVRFGEQNQSMFTDIKIESKEYPDTNESIQILSRLAGDNKGVIPVPKGQNLYNLYENRAYRATITGLGNAMIQPTQYFQLENVPLFNGAYLILSVEHTIEPNKMMTNFSGTKLLKYPVPRVMNPAAIYGFEGGSSDETNPYSMSAGAVVQNFGSAAYLDDLGKITSMYNLKIQ